MRQLLYAMRFTGQATPVGEVGGLFRTATSAPSTVVTSTLGPSGLDGSLEPLPGGEATFEAEVTITGETSFLESGVIAFGDGHRLRFTTVGSGYLGPSADPARQQGAVTWRVEGGEGQFAGASGLITSNFLLEDDLSVTEHHFGVLFVP